MNKKLLSFCLGLALTATTAETAMAGGLLTNTNQNVAFLRLPARDASIDIDGVYLNPAGVAFMNEGFHLGLNWQAAWQTREITTTNPLFALGVNNRDEQGKPVTTKYFKGDAVAPFIPSIQAAYNKGKWSLQFNFAIHGGGGKCTFDNGLGSFESQIGGLAYKLNALGAKGYNIESYLQGKQYYFGFTVGAAYKVNDNLSVYGGVRALYGSASYKASIDPINVATDNGMMTFRNYYDTHVSPFLAINSDKINGLEKLAAAGMLEGENLEAYQTFKLLQGLEQYVDGVNLQSEQEGFGIAPIIGIDYKVGNFNFAGKYEFKTRMSLKNTSTLKKAGVLASLKKFEDGTSIREDNPAMLALGAQWEVIPSVRINAGYHHFYDEESKKYGDTQKLLNGGTNEYLFGAGWDVSDKLTISAGGQITKYGMTDEFMNDMSFVVDSWSWGAGVEYKIKENVKLQLAYFRTNYDNKKTGADANGSTNEFTRSNQVVGAGVTLDF